MWQSGPLNHTPGVTGTLVLYSLQKQGHQIFKALQRAHPVQEYSALLRSQSSALRLMPEFTVPDKP